MFLKQCILPGSLRWHSSPEDDLGLKSLDNIFYIRLVESSTQTVRQPELHVQPHESCLTICPVFLVESYTFAVTHFKALVQLLRTSRIVFESKRCSSISYSHWNSFLSMLRKVKPFFQSTFPKSLLCYCSPCYQLILCAYVLRLHRVLLTCRRIALAFVRNQYSHHDFKVHASSLFAFLVTVLPYFPLLKGCTWRNMYRIVYKSTVLLTKNIKNIVVSEVPALCFATSRFLGFWLHFCDERTVLLSQLRGHERVSIPVGGGRQYLFSNSSVLPFIKRGGDQLTPDHVFRYVDHMDDIGCLAYHLEQDFVYANLTLANIVPFLSRQMVQRSLEYTKSQSVHIGISQKRTL